MPELPEVETARRGIAAAFTGGRITRLIVRDRRLRWPVPGEIEKRVAGRKLAAVERRAKFLLFRLAPGGTVIVHLGMSGSLRIMAGGTPPAKHDHVDFVFGDRRRLRLRDPRRFGCVLWCADDPHAHPLLRHLGPEPLTTQFDGEYLYRRAHGRRLAVKSYLMDSRIVVGVGNIYATEALHAAGIHPARAAGRIAAARYERLATAVKETLLAAIDKGGTTLRDFVDGRGEPGYFGAELRVYGRGGQPCSLCGSTLRHRTLGQRSSFYCPGCQR